MVLKNRNENIRFDLLDYVLKAGQVIITTTLMCEAVKHQNYIFGALAVINQSIRFEHRRV